MEKMEIPEALAQLDRWIVWRMEDGRKVPYSPWGNKARSTAPEDWTRLRTAQRALDYYPEKHYAGLGFVFHEPDGLVGIDLDDCFTGLEEAEEILDAPWATMQNRVQQLKPWAKTIVGALVSTTYTEVSPSGTGLKSWCHGKIPKALKTPIEWDGKPDGAIEVYSRARYFAFTGQRYGAAPLEVADCQTIIDYIYEMAAPEREAKVYPEKFTPGTQHNNLVRIVGALRRHNVCEEAIEACLQIVNAQQCEEPGPAENITQLVKSSENWGHNE